MSGDITMNPTMSAIFNFANAEVLDAISSPALQTMVTTFEGLIGLGTSKAPSANQLLELQLEYDILNGIGQIETLEEGISTQIAAMEYDLNSLIDYLDILDSITNIKSMYGDYKGYAVPASIPSSGSSTVTVTPADFAQIFSASNVSNLENAVNNLNSMAVTALNAKAIDFLNSGINAVSFGFQMGLYVKKLTIAYVRANILARMGNPFLIQWPNGPSNGATGKESPLPAGPLSDTIQNVPTGLSAISDWVSKYNLDQGNLQTFLSLLYGMPTDKQLNMRNVFRTADSRKETNSDSQVYLAGGFHAAYGTSNPEFFCPYGLSNPPGFTFDFQKIGGGDLPSPLEIDEQVSVNSTVYNTFVSNAENSTSPSFSIYFYYPKFLCNKETLYLYSNTVSLACWYVGYSEAEEKFIPFGLGKDLWDDKSYSQYWPCGPNGLGTKAYTTKPAPPSGKTFNSKDPFQDFNNWEFYYQEKTLETFDATLCRIRNVSLSSDGYFLEAPKDTLATNGAYPDIDIDIEWPEPAYLNTFSTSTRQLWAVTSLINASVTDLGDSPIPATSNFGGFPSIPGTNLGATSSSS